ncbi:CMRF35-like molecule 8 isoform 1-T1 [Clarias gariepinus]
MEMVLIFTFCLILGGTDAVTTLTGYGGRSVKIKCNYTSGYEEYIKYLCRGKCPYVGYSDVPVKSGSPAKDSRFSLYDDTTAKVFTVTITDLRPEDGGTYWCGIERAGCDIYKEILLLVKLDNPVISTVSQYTHTTDPTSKRTMGSSVHAESTHPTPATPLNEVTHQTIAPSSRDMHTLHQHNIPGKPGYIVTGTGAVLFALAVIIGIYCKRKHHGSGTVTQSAGKMTGDGEGDKNAQVYHNLDSVLKQSESDYENLAITNNK